MPLVVNSKAHANGVYFILIGAHGRHVDRNILKYRHFWSNFAYKADRETFSTEGILATKLRALLQRNKGRDLVDLSHALEVFPGLDAKTVDRFVQTDPAVGS